MAAEASDAASKRLIQNYLTASGGLAAHEKIHAIRVSGAMRIGRREYDFELVETRRGERWMKQTWRDFEEDMGRRHSMITATDGTEQGTWEQRLTPRVGDPIQLRAEDNAAFRNLSWFFHPFFAPAHADWTFSYQGRGTALGRDTFVVKGEGPDDEERWFYFDAETFLVIRHGRQEAVAQAKTGHDIGIAAFRAREGVHLPSSIVLMLQEATYGRATFHQFEINPAIDPLLFREGEPTREVWIRQESPSVETDPEE